MVLILYQVKKNLSYVLYFDVTTVWMGALSPYKSSFSMVGSRVRFSCSESLNVHMGHQEFNLAPRSLCVVWDQFTTWKRPL